MPTGLIILPDLAGQDCMHFTTIILTLLHLLRPIQSPEQQRNHFSGSQRRVQVSDTAEENVRTVPKPHSDMCLKRIVADILCFFDFVVCLAAISATTRLLKLKTGRLRARRPSRSFI